MEKARVLDSEVAWPSGDEEMSEVAWPSGDEEMINSIHGM